jgi:hypothetical protein
LGTSKSSNLTGISYNAEPKRLKLNTKISRLENHTDHLPAGLLVSSIKSVATALLKYGEIVELN